MALSDLYAQYGVQADDLIQTQDGREILKHAAVERIARDHRISFSAPDVLQASDHSIALLVRANLPDLSRSEWAIGEAYYTVPGRKDPRGNTSFSYPWAVAEKRAKDRALLKVTGMSEFIMSESEADFETVPTLPAAAFREGPGLRIWKDLREALEAVDDPRKIEFILNEYRHFISIMPRTVRQTIDEFAEEAQNRLGADLAHANGRI